MTTSYQGANYSELGQEFFRSEQLKAVNRHIPMALGFSLAIAITMVLVFWHLGNHNPLLVWLMLTLLLTATRFMLVRQCRQLSVRAARTRRLHRLTEAGMVSNAVLWGMAGIMFFPDDPAYQVFLVFMLGGLSAASVTTLYPFKGAAIAFPVICITPIAFRFLFEGSALAVPMSLMLLLFVSGMAFNVIRAFAVFSDNVGAHFFPEAITALQRNEALLRETGRIADIAGWQLSANLKDMYWTDQVQSIVDIPSASRLTYEHFLSLFSPESRARIKADIQNAIQSLTPVNIVADLDVGADEHRWLHIQGLAHETSGEVSHVSGTLQNITGSVQVDQALHESERRLRAILDEMIDTYYRTDAEGRLIMVSRSVRPLLGYEPEEVIGQKLSEFYSRPEEREEFLFELEKNGGQVNQHETRLKHKLGDDIWVSTNARFYYENGEVAGVEGVTRDISETRQCHVELEEHRNELEQKVMDRTSLIYQQSQIIDQGHGAVFSLDLNHTIKSWNRGAERVFGYEQAEMIGKDYFKLHEEHEAEVVGSKIIAEVEQTGVYEGEARMRRKNGELFYAMLTLSMLRSEAGEPFGMTGYVLDITESKQASDALRQSQSRLNFLLAKGPVVIYTCDIYEDMLLPTFVSQNIQDRLGYSAKQCLSEPNWWVSRLHPEEAEQVLSNMENMFSGDLFSHEYRFRMPDGNYIWLRDEIRVIRDERQRPTEIIGYWADITETKLAEQLKDEFVATVSHELRTPLTSISGALGLLQGGAVGRMGGVPAEMVDIAASNSERLLLLINDILDIQQLDSMDIQLEQHLVALKPWLEQAIRENEPYAEQYDVKFALGLPASEADVQLMVDPIRMSQVLANLLSNAVKSSPAGGTVWIQVSVYDDRLRISVIDHGPGVPEDFQSRLFRRFSRLEQKATRNRGGTGLGLSIAKAIVERHHGAIGYQPADTGGAVFWFELPLDVRRQQAAAE